MSTVNVKKEGNDLIIMINGRFDFNILQSFRDAYATQTGGGIHYVIDLAKTDYIDSSALGMLLNMKNHLNAADGTIAIKNCQPNLQKIFSIAHFDKKFKMI
jgi:HptB-dependent secretion and biofilm anti anti-sigma factor